MATVAPTPNKRTKKMETGHPIKYYDNLKEFEEARQLLHNYKRTYVILRNDLLNLIDLAIKCKEDKKAFNALYRACLKGLFSLISYDISYLDRLDAYPDRSDSEKFLGRFKKTFKQICTTWEKLDLLEDYSGSELERLRTMEIKKDRIADPRNPTDLGTATFEDLDLLRLFYGRYDTFHKKVMEGFFIGIKNYPILQDSLQ